ncbi:MULTISPECIES: Na-translocating system protein MpsC family protein [Sporosarcina]|uniref:Na-translocating system protein MpsC family protein n=1 Tax=Sporosarcina TaxID=1569 RepID=UPI00069431A2|nr:MULTISPECIES: Na-translocating system protein MpsC family protein [Sporosarcina]WJY27621.1 Na-translocating system protein MpsC family protein [Sporosarcina sp. 0.2-SM1T-5]
MSGKSTEANITGFLSTFLRTHFGKGPTSIRVTIQKPYVVMHLKGFMAPMEAILCRQGEEKRILETRDLLMQEIGPLLMEGLGEQLGDTVTDLFADWNLDERTGIIIGLTGAAPEENGFSWPDEVDKEELHKRVAQANAKSQKVPGFLDSFWLNDRTVLIKRADILVEIEKELVRQGYDEVLRLVKRPLERKLFKEAGLEPILRRDIEEVYMDWEFDLDVGYIVFILGPARTET